MTKKVTGRCIESVIFYCEMLRKVPSKSYSPAARIVKINDA